MILCAGSTDCLKLDATGSVRTGCGTFSRQTDTHVWGVCVPAPMCTCGVCAWQGGSPRVKDTCHTIHTRLDLDTDALPT